MSAMNNGQRNIIIAIIVVAVVLLCCCCPLAVAAIVWLWNNGDALVGRSGLLLPTLLLLV